MSSTWDVWAEQHNDIMKDVLEQIHFYRSSGYNWSEIGDFIEDLGFMRTFAIYAIDVYRHPRK